MTTAAAPRTALDHLENAMPGVLCAPDACELIGTAPAVMVGHFRFDQARPVHELDDTCPCTRRRTA